MNVKLVELSQSDDPEILVRKGGRRRRRGREGGREGDVPPATPTHRSPSVSVPHLPPSLPLSLLVLLSRRCSRGRARTTRPR